MNRPVPISSAALELIMFESSIAAGFTSPATDHTQKRIDLNAQLVMNPDATFLFRLAGPSMQDIGMFDGDAVLVDRALNAQSGDIVVAELDGEFTCKRYIQVNGIISLVSENKDFEPIIPTEFQTLSIWGVVTVCLRMLFHSFGKKNAKASAKHRLSRRQ